MSERFSISTRSIEGLAALHYALRETNIRNANPDSLREFFPPTQPLTILADIPPRENPPLPPRQVLERLTIAASELTLNIGHNAHTINPNHDPHSPLPESLSILQRYFPDISPLTTHFGFGEHAAYVSVTSPVNPNTQPVNLHQAIQDRNFNHLTTYSGLAHIQDRHSLGDDWESKLFITDHPGPTGTKLRTSGLLTWHT